MDPHQIWKELRHLGISPGPGTNMADFSPDDLNQYFALIEDKFDFRLVTLEEVTRAMNASTSRAEGVDGFSQNFIKAAFPTTRPFVFYIISKSLAISYFPDTWKQALITVITLNKIPSPRGLRDFCLISLLCFLSKVLERLVFEQIHSHHFDY